MCVCFFVILGLTIKRPGTGLTGSNYATITIEMCVKNRYSHFLFLVRCADLFVFGFSVSHGTRNLHENSHNWPTMCKRLQHSYKHKLTLVTVIMIVLPNMNLLFCVRVCVCQIDWHQLVRVSHSSSYCTYLHLLLREIFAVCVRVYVIPFN